jgi:hypothetical protein
MTLLLGVCGMLCGCGAPQAGQVAKLPMSSELILRDVTVVDTHDGSLSPHMDIMMDRGKIVSIAPTGISASSASARTIDAPGEFVVPGYLDMHAHVLGTKQTSEMLTLMLANGIIGFSQMSGSSDLLAQRKNGTLPISGVAPELLVMLGTILTPPNAGSPSAAVATVNEQKAEGADLIKVILVSFPTFFAAQGEAKRLGLPFVGHLPLGVDIVAASHGGMKSIENLGAGPALMIPCSTDEAALHAVIAKSSPHGRISVQYSVPYPLQRRDHGLGRAEDGRQPGHIVRSRRARQNSSDYFDFQRGPMPTACGGFRRRRDMAGADPHTPEDLGIGRRTGI